MRIYNTKKIKIKIVSVVGLQVMYRSYNKLAAIVTPFNSDSHLGCPAENCGSQFNWNVNFKNGISAYTYMLGCGVSCDT